jgi:O-antigen/teichoic acid export membrane protein
MISVYIKKVAKNFSWLVFDKLFFMLFSFVFLIYVANYYGPSEYGGYQYALSLNIIFGVVVLFVDEKIVKKLFTEEGESRVLFNALISKIALSVFSLAIGMAILLMMNASKSFNLIYIFLLVNNIIISIIFLFSWHFDYHLRSKSVVLASNFTHVVSALIQVTVIALALPIVFIASAVLFCSLLKLSIVFHNFNKSYKNLIIPIIEKELIYKIIKSSFPLAIAGAAAMIYSRTDQIMIGSMLSLEQVGIYSISSQMMSVVFIAIIPIQISVYPKMLELYESNKDFYYKKYQVISSFSIWLYFFGAVLSIILAPLFFNYFLSSSYSKSLDVFFIHLIGGFFMYNAVFRSSHFTIIGNTKILMISQIIAIFINVLLNYFLIPRLGISGAAIATVFTLFISLTLSNIFFKDGRKIFFIQIKSLNPLSMLLK